MKKIVLQAYSVSRLKKTIEATAPGCFEVSSQRHGSGNESEIRQLDYYIGV
ncbi:protein [Escherichia coli]|uniref:Protein n=1 Tax=Escherichia coli TaxID=562 RepID=A0A377DBB7_ECOLX|nr:protein [Escherichia coli]